MIAVINARLRNGTKLYLSIWRQWVSGLSESL